MHIQPESKEIQTPTGCKEHGEEPQLYKDGARQKWVWTQQKYQKSDKERWKEHTEELHKKDLL